MDSNIDIILEIALNADYQTTLALLNTYPQLLLDYDFWNLKCKKYLINFDTILRAKEDIYWNSKIEDVFFHPTLLKINKCIHIASKNGGRVFGGFIRNVLIPQTF